MNLERMEAIMFFKGGVKIDRAQCTLLRYSCRKDCYIREGVLI